MISNEEAFKQNVEKQTRVHGATVDPRNKDPYWVIIFVDDERTRIAADLVRWECHEDYRKVMASKFYWPTRTTSLATVRDYARVLSRYFGLKYQFGELDFLEDAL